MTDARSNGPLRTPEWIFDDLTRFSRGDAGIVADMEHLGLSRLHDVDETTRTAFLPVLDARLADMGKDAARATRDHLDAVHGADGDHARLFVDPVTAAALRDCGTAIAAVAILNRLHHDLVLHWDGSVVRVDVFEVRNGSSDAPVELMTVQIPLGDGLTWEGNLIHGVGTLPDTISGTIVGMPLRAVVSHPLLDRFDLNIAGWTEDVLEIDVLGLAEPVFAPGCAQRTPADHANDRNHSISELPTSIPDARRKDMTTILPQAGLGM